MLPGVAFYDASVGDVERAGFVVMVGKRKHSRRLRVRLAYVYVSCIPARL